MPVGVVPEKPDSGSQLRANKKRGIFYFSVAFRARPSAASTPALRLVHWIRAASNVPHALGPS